ncbi:MAG: hypothetical protein ACM3ZV_02595 [Bacillota bacterium]
MEDWEQHFAEKSRRRFDKERLDRRRQRRNAYIAAALIGSGILAAIAGLAIFR